MGQVRTLVTAEQFWESYANKKFPRYELVNGELVEMAHPGGTHGGIAATLATALDNHVRQNRPGCVVVETGYRIQRDPDTVRSPDVSFISTGRLPPGGLPQGFVKGPPDLAIVEDGSVIWCQDGNTLEDEEVLPGFVLPVSELFAS